MNKIALAVGGVAPDKPKKKPTQKPEHRARSHIRQARSGAKKPDAPTTGPMAEMLKKLLGK